MLLTVYNEVSCLVIGSAMYNKLYINFPKEWRRKTQGGTEEIIVE